jgi:hypothetical protein
VNENTEKALLSTEIKRGHFARAAFVALSLGLPEGEVLDLRLKALWQISAVYRNAPGTKKLSQEYGFSKKELKKQLEKLAEDKRNEGDERPLEPCYDHNTGKHLSFEEWMDHLLRNWDKLAVL